MLHVPEAEMAGRVVSRVQLDRTMAGPNVSGTVVLSEVVDKDGFIEHIRVLSGPQPARAAAVFAARQWSYKPYLVDGHAVAVETTATLELPSDGATPTPVPPAQAAPIHTNSQPAQVTSMKQQQKQPHQNTVSPAPGPQVIASNVPAPPLPTATRTAYRTLGGPHAPMDLPPVLVPGPGATTLRFPAQWKLSKRISPVYPPAAEASGIEGIVVVQGTVKRDGTLHGLAAISGPPELRQAALDAAAQWEFALDRRGDPQDTPIRESVEFLLKGPAHIPADVMAGRTLHTVQPEYPADAQSAGVTGSVVLHVLVGRQGQLEQAKAVSGPSQLRAAALAAVKQWTWKPYLRNGVDQEVETDVVVAFSMQWAGVQ